MPGGIGFYVHHHGQGHANRVRQIVTHLEGPVTVFGSSLGLFQSLENNNLSVQELPSDVVPISPSNTDWPDILHYAPLTVPGIRQRMFQLANWIERTDPALLVVDVSVEVALFARLMSVPTVIMRQNGVRDDRPHQAAYQSCIGLLAPYPAIFEEPSTPAWIQSKTFYSGGFSRYARRTLTRQQARKDLSMDPERPCVVVMNGLGGSGAPLLAITQAAQACPKWDWWVVGPTDSSRSDVPVNMKMVGKVADTFPYLKGANVVVASAGNNTVMEIATAGTPYVCIPEERPFDEQFCKAEALRRANAAYVLTDWLDTDQWPELLEDAKRTDTQPLSNVINPQGAQRCAEYIKRMSKVYK